MDKKTSLKKKIRGILVFLLTIVIVLWLSFSLTSDLVNNYFMEITVSLFFTCILIILLVLQDWIKRMVTAFVPFKLSESEKKIAPRWLISWNQIYTNGITTCLMTAAGANLLKLFWEGITIPSKFFQDVMISSAVSLTVLHFAIWCSWRAYFEVRKKLSKS